MDGNISGAECGFQASKGIRYIQAMGLVIASQPIRILYYKGRPDIGNDQLTPEQRRILDRAKLNNQGIKLLAVSFWGNTDNLIEWARPMLPTWQPKISWSAI